MFINKFIHIFLFVDKVKNYNFWGNLREVKSCFFKQKKIRDLKKFLIQKKKPSYLARLSL